MKEKFPEKNQACVSEAAAAAVAASSSDHEEGSVPNWRLEEEFDPQVAVEVINSRNALLGAGSDGRRFSHLQSIIRTGFGREKSGAGIEAFWRRIIDDPDAFPPEFWPLFLQSNLTALGEQCRPVCVGMTWRRLIAAGIMRQWRPRLEEANREARQFGVGVRGGVEQVALRARVHHEAKKLADPHRSLQRIQRSEADCYASGGRHLRACRRLHRSWQNVTARCLRPCSFRWNREKGGRSTAPVGCNKGMPWARRCSASCSCRC